MSRLSGRGLSAATLLLSAAPFGAVAQVPATAPDIVVTPNRSPQPIQRSGSAITVVTREDLQRTNPTSLVDALRRVPGLDITETGGPGATTAVRLRGANAGQTLVLIDGVRVNDPSGAAGEFDFSSLLPSIIDRIEVLRGPQSALYGSDAIGGVINIITRRGTGAPQFSGRVEGGSYATAVGDASVSGSHGPWSFAFAGGGQRTDGFSRYGHRIGRITRSRPFLENDGFERFGGYGRVGYDFGSGAKVEVGALSTTTFIDFDAVSADLPAFSERRFDQAWASGTATSFNGRLTHNLQVFANRTDRAFREASFTPRSLPLASSLRRDRFIGDRAGAEYQGTLALDAFGSLILGAKVERETADTFTTALIPRPAPRRRNLAEEQTTRSGFALWQLPVGERLNLSLGGRIDDVQGADRFATWRATAAYLIPETGTKLRASVGTGGKAPTLFQLYAGTFGNPDLRSEESFGLDAGIDQSLFGGRVNLSVTGFFNTFDNLIDFTDRYVNVAKAETSGVEVEGTADLVEDWLRLRVAYTYLHAEDTQTGLTLARRPEHVGRVGLTVTPWAGVEIEPSLVLVSERFSRPGERERLAPYARLDLYAAYRLDATWRVFGRLENITDTNYQEAYNYGTTGRAIYGGLSATW